MCINLIFFLEFLLWNLRDSNKLKVDWMLFSINASGPSIDLSTCVSAAKLKIIEGLYFLSVFIIIFLFPISDLIKT